MAALALSSRLQSHDSPMHIDIEFRGHYRTNCLCRLFTVVRWLVTATIGISLLLSDIWIAAIVFSLSWVCNMLTDSCAWCHPLWNIYETCIDYGLDWSNRSNLGDGIDPRSRTNAKNNRVVRSTDPQTIDIILHTIDWSQAHDFLLKVYNTGH